MTAKMVKTKLVPPDGGWGWIILFSALVVNFLIPGTVKSFGVLFPEFLQVFKASPTAASWMPALCYFLYSSLGPLSSVLSMKYSYKTVTVIGGAFAASGMMLSYFATSVSYLYVSYGIMVGIGAGLTFPPTVYIVTSYFERLRGFANGLCISGSAIGTIVLPLFLQYLLDQFGHRGAVLIMGAITLNTLVCGLLYHPVEQHMKEVPIDEGIDNEAMSLDEPATETKIRMSLPSIPEPNTIVPHHDTSNSSTGTSSSHLADLSKYLEKTLSSTVEIEDERTNRCEEESDKSEDTEEPRVESTSEQSMSDGSQPSVATIIEASGNTKCPITSSLVATPPLSRGNSSRKSTGRENSFHLSRQHSIVSDMGPIALSPRVPGLFKRIFRTQPTKSRGNDKLDSKETIVHSDNMNSSKKLDEDSSQSTTSSSLSFFDFSVLTDPIYLVILISNSTSAISNTNFMILLPSYAISEGFDKNRSAVLLSIVSAFDLVGRIGGASLSDMDFIPKYYYFVCGLGLSGIALALLPMAVSYTMLSFFCALFGLSSGMYIGITTVILADMLGTEKLSSSYGISLFVNGVLQLVGPPLCGFVYEQVGSYKPIFLTLGIILILGTALWAAVPIIKRNKKDVEAA
ncbi:monocarboxylate transporter 13-like [Venturia canescens]|uniref:monocarboxylate transporter 13-like n=1 Tax=Venturia canescens TaxID=32260 RepID=UPI001C9D49D8|nr:monocarboxylate transporter 13-like [Venturia canescens]XP_043267563.1 monocarboxylate transporter 13-like [Venturia canescens]XP_043267565.1 monocarboxylate transporter 13-like [Venturia canescens]XP_043267566.1 monocarboxylate transporter 13-like [Venturia canescens]